MLIIFGFQQKKSVEFIAHILPGILLMISYWFAYWSAI